MNFMGGGEWERGLGRENSIGFVCVVGDGWGGRGGGCVGVGGGGSCVGVGRGGGCVGVGVGGGYVGVRLGFVTVGGIFKLRFSIFE